MDKAVAGDEPFRFCALISNSYIVLGVSPVIITDAMLVSAMKLRLLISYVFVIQSVVIVRYFTTNFCVWPPSSPGIHVSRTETEVGELRVMFLGSSGGPVDNETNNNLNTFKAPLEIMFLLIGHNKSVDL